LLVLIFLTLLIDILVRLVNPTPAVLVSDIPLISSWIDIVLAVEFGMPVAMEIYSSFLCDLDWSSILSQYHTIRN